MLCCFKNALLAKPLLPLAGEGGPQGPMRAHATALTSRFATPRVLTPTLSRLRERELRAL